MLAQVIDHLVAAKDVVIIEDSPTTLFLMERVVGMANPEALVHTATTLEQAAEIRRRINGDAVVLSDYNFPEGEGHPIARNGRASFDLFGSSCRFFAIVSDVPWLHKDDSDLERFRVDKTRFIDLLSKGAASLAEHRNRGILLEGVTKAPAGRHRSTPARRIITRRNPTH